MLFFEIIMNVFANLIAGFLTSFFGLDDIAKNMRKSITINNFNQLRTKYSKRVSIISTIAGAIMGAIVGFLFGVIVGVGVVVLSLGGILFNFEKAVNVISWGCVIFGAITCAVAGFRLSVDDKKE